MKAKDYLSFYGLKWDPFAPNVPIEALSHSEELKQFCWRIENLILDGGYGMITGEPGTGKSCSLRIVAHRLEQIKDVQVGLLARPQSRVADFYRELGDLFGMNYRVSNRWNCYKDLRLKWQEHIKTTLMRPVLLIDEAQEMPSDVLNELRLLSSVKLDSQVVLAVILSGDGRLIDRFKGPDLVPLASRIRVKLTHRHLGKEELVRSLKHSILEAGNANLMSEELISTVCEHAMGNYRSLMVMCSNLLLEGQAREKQQLNEQLFIELFGTNRKNKKG